MTYRVAPLEKKPGLDCPGSGSAIITKLPLIVMKLKQCYVNYVNISVVELAALQCNCEKSLFLLCFWNIERRDVMALCLKFSHNPPHPVEPILYSPQLLDNWLESPPAGSSLATATSPLSPRRSVAPHPVPRPGLRAPSSPTANPPTVPMYRT